MKKMTVILACTAMSVSAMADSGNASIQGGPTLLTEDLVVGTGGFGGGVVNDTFIVESQSGASVSLLTGVPFWGSAYDPVGNRVLYTSSGGTTDGADLSAIDVDTGVSSPVGTITANTFEIRIDGLAMSNGVLYGVNQFADANNASGMYSIDLGTLEATFVAALPDGAVSGIGADPTTGIIYAVDDTAAQVQQIDLDGTITNLAAYPAGYTDVDGLAVGYGVAYLVADEAQDIVPLDLSSLTYGTPITTPFTAADTFSGGAFVHDVIFADDFQ